MTDFCLQRHVHAPVEAVWRAWTTSEGIATWWWPQLPDTSYEMEARVGGRYRFESTAAGIGVHGEFTTVDEPHLLELTWLWVGGDEPEGADRVRVELQPDGDGTSVTVTHQQCQPADSGDDLRQGWGDVLDRLAALDG